MKSILLLQVLLFPILISSQNLVPDPGFEDFRRLPGKNNNSISCTKNWSPTNGAGDYYHFEADRHAGTPKNIFGKQEPHSGNAYGGICIRKNFIEYLGTKLTQPLTAGQEYLVEFYISRANRSIGSVEQFGALFTKKLIWGISDQGIQQKPSVDLVKSKGYRNKKKWMKVSGIFKADGGENALTIGYFNYEKPKGPRVYCHYYIDDVSVTPINPVIDSVPLVKKDEPAPMKFFPKSGEAITLKNVFFESNKSELLPTSHQELDKLVRHLKDAPNSTIKINGHTDNSGNEVKNKALSEARAKAVRDYLVLKGIDGLRIQHSGFGSSKPIASNDTEEGRNKNRRVEFVIEEN